LLPIRSESKYSLAAGWVRIFAQSAKAVWVAVTIACASIKAQVSELS